MFSKREQAMLRQIDDEVKARVDEIASGSLTPDQYKDMTGFVRGLRLAAAFIKYLEEQENPV